MALARRFGAEGFAITLMSRSAEKLAGYVADLAVMGIHADHRTVDLANADSIRAGFSDVGEVSLLIFNASVLSGVAPSELDAETVVADFRVNVVAAIECARQVLPRMKQRNSGTLLFTGSGLSRAPLANFASLSIGKSGMRSFALSLSQELEGTRVRAGTITICGMIQPGSEFDPDRIADAFWEKYSGESWTPETTFPADSTAL